MARKYDAYAVTARAITQNSSALPGRPTHGVARRSGGMIRQMVHTGDAVGSQKLARKHDASHRPKPFCVESAQGPRSQISAPPSRDDVHVLIGAPMHTCSSGPTLHRRHFGEWVHQPEFSLHQKPIMHVFGVEYPAARDQRRGNDHRVID